MIIISGASGFIGRRLAAQLRGQQPGTDLRCLAKENDDAFGQSGVRHLKSNSVIPILSDLVTGRGLSGLRSPEIIFHLAANTHTWEPDQRCNDIGTENLIRAVSPLGPESHFIFTSTVAVMDNRKDLGSPLRADTPTDGPPMNRYGLSKWRAEKFLLAEARRRGFRLSIVRLCTVYGPEFRPNTFFDVLKKQVERGTIASRLNWPGLTSFIHVQDVVECLLRVASNPPPSGQPRICLLATESGTLQDAARVTHAASDLPYQEVVLPQSIWRTLGRVHELCRIAQKHLPPAIYNSFWRMNLVINPVFYCDTVSMKDLFPGLNFRRMRDSIAEVLSVPAKLCRSSASDVVSEHCLSRQSS